LIIKAGAGEMRVLAQVALAWCGLLMRLATEQ
jgi:hypothetical protein